jgi:hypothetical protein
MGVYGCLCVCVVNFGSYERQAVCGLDCVGINFLGFEL